VDNHTEQEIVSLDPQRTEAVTESGELERPALRRRRIDCSATPEATDRRVEHRGGRRGYDLSHAS
jgi:hypothetical protein